LLILISEPRVDDSCLPFILQCAPNLEVFALNYSGITDEGVKRISKDARGLKCLNLFACNSISVKCAAELETLSELRWLGIGLSGACPTVGKNEFVRRLERTMPKCRVDCGG